MKKILLSIVILIAFTAFTQKDSIPQTLFEYESEFYTNTIEFITGERMLFSQLCTTKYPREVPNNNIGFNNYNLGNIQYKLVVSFKDTIIVRTDYKYKGSNLKNALNSFGLKKSQFKKEDGVLIYRSSRDNIKITSEITGKTFWYSEEVIQNK